MANDPEQLAHQEWLGYVQPIGLVVSIPALLQAQAHVQRNIAAEHQRFLACLPRDKQDEVDPEIRDFPEFTRSVLGWEAADLIGLPSGEQIPPELEATLPGYNETLRPTYAVREFQPKDASRPWMLLIKSLPVDNGLDALSNDAGSHWHATPHAKFERLLRETQIPFGLLVNGTHLRLVYAPRGETSGYATFSVADMAKVAGRPIFAALHMLLNVERLFSLPEKQRLPAILADSRKYQNVVSTQLAEQVLGALYELVRGFQAADEQRRSELLREVLAADPNHVYGGLLTVLLRLVFILYAEDRGLLSSDPVYSNYYSITGLFERLRADAGRYPDTMDQRYGAWAQLLTLFRMIYDGGRHGGLRIPARRGYLFDPDRYNFLEGRSWKSTCRLDEKVDVPRVADGVIYRVLEKLLILDGERLSYRTLDVEQIGSVYETMMGFNLEVAEGRSIAIKPTKSHGAPTALNLDALLATKPADRVKWIAEKSDQKLTGQAAESLKSAATIEALLAGLDRKIAHLATPNVVPKGAMVLQPSDERRRSGSHYTPRSLTEPIVRTTLKPILEQLGEHPRPEQILALKVCDSAMGSGAFLVEACRQLGDALVEAWHVHNCLPALPPDEDELLHARRLIAQRCLYGVDKNPMAVDLSKLSLWLATLAKDHPFTFLDHSLRAGDSLVGLSREQIAAFHWQPRVKRSKDDVWFGDPIAERMRTVTEYRQRILAARDDKPYEQLRQELDVADEALSLARLTGDCVIAAYFSAGKDRERATKLEKSARQLVQYIGPQRRIEDRQPLTAAVASLHNSDYPIHPFHWEIEFPEVFGHKNNGFDAMVGNPPFIGGSQFSEFVGGPIYQEWLKTINKDAFGNGDLCAYFFRRGYELLSRQGTFGFLATKTISEGGTRISGLKPILASGGRIYNAVRSQRWPGHASVLVAVVHIAADKVKNIDTPTLDGKPVTVINSRLYANDELPDPVQLSANMQKGYFGTKLGGSGFILSPEEYTQYGRDPRNNQCLIPYLGGEEVNSSPAQRHERYVINFGTMSLESAEQFPELLERIRIQVRPMREKALDHGPGAHGKKYWWQFILRADPLVEAISGLSRCIVTARTTAHLAFSFQPIRQVFSESIVAFASDRYAYFGCLQSSVHYFWAVMFSSYMGQTLRYSVSDAFQTFPLPHNCESHPLLEAVSKDYYEFRAALMVRNNEGLTKTYNRFHDPHETSPDILQLRALHAAMDRAVLEPYGWHDLAQTATYEFLLDYEEAEDDEEGSSGRRRKKPWRYRWPDDFRDEVLARLLALNAERADQERLAGIAAEVADGNRKGRKKSAKGTKAGKNSTDQPSLPGLGFNEKDER